MQKGSKRPEEDELGVSDIKIRTENELLESQIKKQQKLDVEGQDGDQSCIFSIFTFFLDFIRLYSMGERQEKILVAVGVIIGLISGVAFPMTMYIWGKQIDHITKDIPNLENNLSQSRDYLLGFIGVGLGSLLFNTILFAVWKLISQKIARKYRQRYMEAFVKKSMKWIDSVNLYETSNSFKENAFKIQKAIGDKVALFFNLIGMMTSGIISALIIRWTLSLYLIALIPLALAIFGYFIYIFIIRKIDTKEFYKESESRSVQALAMIQTVKSLGAENFQESLYENSLNIYKEKVSVYPLKLSIATGLFYFIQYFMFGIGFLFGVQCVKGTSACPVSVTGSNYSIGELHIVFFQIFICSFNLLQLGANYEAIRDAIKSSKEIYRFISDSQQIKKEQAKDIKKIEGLQVNVGEILFKNVVFAYPSNPQKIILKGITLKPLINKFNALVGVTGSGKSTISKLLLKFYQINEGQILIGGRQISQIDEQWLRERVSIVEQQYSIFDGTIAENVRVGKKDATDSEIWQALRKCNLSQFVEKLPGQLNYAIGLGGSKLSGGQKQRLSIARALVKKPQLLILDQATSALDRKSEKIVQKTLNKIFTAPDLDMNVICIAHKIRTIAKADRIWYLQNGIVKQEGKFKEMKCFQDVQLPAEEEQQVDLFEQQFSSIPKSADSIENEQKKQVAQQRQSSKSIYSELLQYTDQKGSYALAIFLSFFNGLCHPFAILLLAYIYYNQMRVYLYGNTFEWCSSPIVFANQLCQENINNNFDQSIKFIGGLIGFSFFCFIPFFLKHYLMSNIEDQISLKLKGVVYKKLLRMSIRWYQQSQNEGGQAASNYGTDVMQMSTLTTTYIPVLITNVTTMVTGVIICLVYYWRIGLLTLYAIPLIAAGCFITMIFVSGYDDQNLHKYSSSNKTALELMMNIKTALSFNHHHTLLKKYKDLIYEGDLSIFKSGAKIGAFYGLSVFLIVISIGLILFPTAHIVARQKQADNVNILVAVVVPLWCGWVAGCSFFFVSGAGAGKESAKRVFKLLSDPNQSEVQKAKISKNIKLDISTMKGRFQLKNVSFRYKQNQKPILNNINLTIVAGKKTAFVGESGCGKTTLMFLLQRFYDYEGEITLDGVNILQYDLQSYRSCFAVINQQPSLFTGTVSNNIRSNSGASDKELQEACKSAFVYDLNRAWKGDISLEQNIRQFVAKDAGHRGSKVSGGQKQRVACARAILKKPKIFLMDEGTAALDGQTEKRLMQNIDQKLKDITTVGIAHRMEAIENYDSIYLFEDGKIVEHGRYEEMMARKTYFFKFVQGNKFKTIDQVANAIIKKLVMKLLGIKK